MRVGILGGGQLGLMLAESLLHLSAEVTVLDPDPESPAKARLANVAARGYDDAKALAAFFAASDVVTYDSENIPAAPLLRYAKKLLPPHAVLAASQHRAAEKTFLARRGFPVVEHRVVKPGADLTRAARDFGFPCIAKTALGGYDGKGQHRLDDEAQAAALPQVPGGWVLEEVLSLETELSVVVACGDGEPVAFPVFENLHSAHILDFTVLPARVSPALQEAARATALAVAKALAVRGLLTVEFFVGRGRGGRSQLFINELAPRTHNSGHVTRQACSFSQFDALARVLCGLKVPQPTLHPGCWVMGNLLGDVWLSQGRQGGALDLRAWRDFPDVVDVFLYGKAQARAKRKMGHFVVRGKTPAATLKRARAFRAALMDGTSR